MITRICGKLRAAFSMKSDILRRKAMHLYHCAKAEQEKSLSSPSPPPPQKKEENLREVYETRY